MEGPKGASEILLPAIVDPTFAAPRPNEIKKEFSFSELNSHGGFVKHVIGSAYTGTILQLEIEEEVKPDITNEVSLPAIIDTKSETSHPNEIKQEFPLFEPHSHSEFVEYVVKQEDTNSIHSLDLQIKPEVPDLKCGMKTDNKDIYIKFEPLVSEELHIKNETCSSEKPFKCSLCSYRSVQKGNLQAHMRTHTGEKPFKCNICDYRSVRKDTLQGHMKTHTGEKPLKCNICDYRLGVKSNFQAHMRTHTGEKPFKCNVCGYRSVRKDTLQGHMKTHTGEKPFKCNVCDYRSVRKDSLQGHMKTHTGKIPLKCNICDYTCIVKGYLQKHMKTHTGDKPFKCSICGYRSRVNSNLRRHIKTHTGENC